MRPEQAPCSLIAFEIVTGEAQLNEPAGIVIVSPFCAWLSWMNCTFPGVPSELYTVAPQRTEKPTKIKIDAKITHAFIPAAYRSSRYPATHLHIRINCHRKRNSSCRTIYLASPSRRMSSADQPDSLPHTTGLRRFSLGLPHLRAKL